MEQSPLIIWLERIMTGFGAGWVMYLMLGLSVISVAVILERAWFFNSLKDDLSVIENLRFMKDFIGTSQREVADVIGEVGLDRVKHNQARNLSAGQRKRCALARLLLSEAGLWLLDEPYSNLDTEGVELVDRLLVGHLEGGGSAVVATHGAHRPDWSGTVDYYLESGAVA